MIILFFTCVQVRHVHCGGLCVLFDLLCRLGRMSAAQRRLAWITSRVPSGDGVGAARKCHAAVFTASLVYQQIFLLFFFFPLRADGSRRGRKPPRAVSE